MTAVESNYDKAFAGLKGSVEVYNVAGKAIPTPTQLKDVPAALETIERHLAIGVAIDQARATLALVDAVRSLDSMLREVLPLLPGPLSDEHMHQIQTALAEAARKRGVVR